MSVTRHNEKAIRKVAESIKVWPCGTIGLESPENPVIAFGHTRGGVQIARLDEIQI
ncbi:MAG: hypothetical protein ACLTXI_02735 [Collinsella sp.]